MFNLGVTCLIALFCIHVVAGQFVIFPGARPTGSKTGEICNYGAGLTGRCEPVSSCRTSNGGHIKAENGTKVCGINGETGAYEVCCRRPFKIAETLCDAWKSYWRVNERQCIEETPLIVGGIEALVGQFPEIGILGIEDNEGNIHWLCGGTLITPHFVLTAAHCVLRLGQYIMRFGEHDRLIEDLTKIPRIRGKIPLGIHRSTEFEFERRVESSREQTIRVKDITIYSEYQRPYNDIALVELQDPVVITRRVMPACLPTNPIESYTHLNVTAAGWGKLAYNKAGLSRTLQKVKFPVIESLICEERLRKVSKRIIPKGIQDTQMCTGDLEKDTCQGDSGGPIVAQISDKLPCEHSLLGIVSVGHGCSDFGINTRVSSYMDWIMQHIAPKAIPNNF